MDHERKRLVITSEDLPAAVSRQSLPPAYGSTAPAGAWGPPTSRKATLPASGAPTFFRSTLGTSLIGAVLAIVPAWLALEASLSNSATHLVWHSALEVACFGAVFGAIFSGWEDASGKVWEKAWPAAGIGLALGAVFGAISGAIAQELFGHIVENIVRNAQSLDDLVRSYKGIDFYLARALAWAIFGVGMGVAVGVAKRSTQKAVNGLVGGAVGGAVGGLVFHWITTQPGVSGGVSRLLGLAVVGTAIGIAIGLVEVARRQAWVKIVGGGMTGKEFVVYHASTNFGSSAKCQVTLIKDPGIAPVHFRIDEHGPKRLLTPYEGAPTSINGAAVSQHWLRNGDLIQAGGTSLQYLERAAA